MSTTVGIKVDEELRARLKAAAEGIGRTPHWLAKQGLIAAIERAERGDVACADDEAGTPDLPGGSPSGLDPFLAFAEGIRPQSVLRARITAAYRRPETECLPFLISEAALPASAKAEASRIARELVEALRAKATAGRVDGLIREYSLSTQEGVALMCLAEALLRIPDRATREALIRDKIATGDWQSHLGHSPSLFVNAATWGLVVTGKLTGTASERNLSSALSRLIGRGGEPLIRKGVEIAMRLMGEQFVTGQTIGEALANSRRHEAKGFRYSYDMLGEAAMTAADAARYYADYEQAIHAIGKASGKRGIYEGPGISVKLSALHPRYSRAQIDRVMGELLPKLKALAVLARHYDIGLNIDAEEADRLEISLDLLEALCFDPELAGWNGIGFVIQAYGKRCPFVIDYLIDLARRSRRRIMVRLVKGAYWDSEIKRAQIDGLEDFPVYTRKIHTDVSYLACARRLLAAPDAIFPQFATHNAQTLATVMTMAGENYYAGQYEFQCLHGMGEPLYEEVVGPDKLGRPCRIYAPVGTHETLLAYLVRRLLENGANTSFVNRISDPDVSVDEMIADPVEAAAQLVPVGAPHPRIAAPRDLFAGERLNSAGLDLTNEQRLASLAATLLGSGRTAWSAQPLVGEAVIAGEAAPVINPADHRDHVGTVVSADEAAITTAFENAVGFAPIWAATPPIERAASLERAADLLEERMPALIGLIVREAGKSIPNAVSEVREAVDFLRYYAEQVKSGFEPDTHRPLGPVVCISPWNFPLAIFTGQIAAALAAGNPVLAKPAEETPLIAAEAIRILREAGVPAAALQFLPGDGRIGAALVADPHVRGVMFTGSTEVARLIQKSLAQRLTPEGRVIPLIAETGGQNAMIVDSSALAEQVATDVIQSAFDSAGQRCSALRILCVQEDVADRMLAMLKGAMAELVIGNPDRLATDVGPVITAEARDKIEAHVMAMRGCGLAVEALPLPEGARHGTFVPPTLIEIEAISDVEQEVFGPVLHVLRYRRDEVDALVDDINGTGYGLTFGLHTRIDETIAAVTKRIEAGNIYVNRNVIGAVVGVQPFGGNGLSGTGPKAGGPLYLTRLVVPHPDLLPAQPGATLDPAASALAGWLDATGRGEVAARCRDYALRGGLGVPRELKGPVGERDIYGLRPRGAILIRAQTEDGFFKALGAALAAGNRVVIERTAARDGLVDSLPEAVRARLAAVSHDLAAPFDAVLFEGDGDALAALNREIADRPGALVAIHAVSVEGLASGREDFALSGLVEEVSISTNTAAAGGNANLMTIG
ncbi:trifunctional transcriptional regulator/proline dehydrogenase/L-glutamate gamma-semialdehyde dehydrogenase [Kaistia dalseonensis]|uniref:Bifunctional protein PutA n=1 Tax=Kaistia dalseonensis TaxID=410840 RepID=A0ABU0H6V8_9HYPH|nr:trifunctional transcriptional regulator/proline dehydrogenase/L-glutamate gamma-semialdehyde dehydrogenase [Kaistia dalseonensis]MCX5494668.1 trifunctional transcriptional regulator/proline dehydrogenase/L-glutamate gamma-semialdehyde dehydrogenase [Kaistia dalseonensis]MDQ0437249.1 RHH-type proline utilization regulon transcriptional repressor/proline dehydrogenase/delta 1-pyrroline-5-carboxylate dehydrogenase [Kaistia dalseonensis]